MISLLEDEDVGRRRVIIESVSPEIDGGRFPIKRVIGESVTVEAVRKVMASNRQYAQKLIMAVAPKLGPERQPCPLGVETMLDMAVMTAPDKRDLALMAKLDAVAGRVLKK